MYIEAVPKPELAPAILLRESYREGRKVRKRTSATFRTGPPPTSKVCAVGAGSILRRCSVEILQAALLPLSHWARGVEFTKESNTMTKSSTAPVAPPLAIVAEALQQVGASFDRFCLASGVAAL